MSIISFLVVAPLPFIAVLHGYAACLSDKIIEKHKGFKVFAVSMRGGPVIFWKKAREFPAFIQEWNERARWPVRIRDFVGAAYLLMLLLAWWFDKYGAH